MYYSRIQKDNSCVLTGVCYDEDLLTPMYDFIDNYKHYPSANYQTFEDIIQYCFDSLNRAIEREIEHQNSDEAIIEDFEANDFLFHEDGRIYNN